MLVRRLASAITGVAVVAGLSVSAVYALSPAWDASFATAATPGTAATQLGGPGVVPSLPDALAAPDGLREATPLVIVPRPLGMTPPMGWNGFNRFHIAVNETLVESEARALVTSGMQAAGYQYVNLDGGWALPRRNARGSLVANPARFPHGIKALAEYVHSLGLKFGIYTSAGTQNCAGTSAGSFGHYSQDAAAFASWGVDYVKLDWCYIPYYYFPGMTHRQVAARLAAQMHLALASTGRPIVYDLNDPADDNPSSWARGLAHLWRTAPDSQDRYSSVLWNFTHTVDQFRQAGPGGWNDPDMLEVGNGGMSATEYQTQFSLWAEMAAPLIAGTDLSKMSAITRQILTNQAVIAVDQDPLGRQGYPVANASGHWVLVKPLANGDRALLLFNQTSAPATITTSLAQVGMVGAGQFTLLDLWTGNASETTGVVSATVPPHGVVFFAVGRSDARPFTTG